MSTGKVEIHCSYQKLLPIVDIKRHPDNPNKHSDDQIKRLAEILLYQGIRHPIIVSDLTSRCVAGHGRLMALKKIGVKEVPVDVQHFDTEDQEYAFLVSDNAIQSDWIELDVAMINQKLPEIKLDRIELLGMKDLKVDVSETQIDGEIEFATELGRENNYLVLKFDTDIDFINACDLFDLKSVATEFSKMKNGKPWSCGLGRVIDGVRAIEKIRK